MLQLGCPPLDDLLGDGIENGIITKLYGEAGTGKTNILLQASRECVKNGRKVVYIDTEGVSLERLRQMCTPSQYKTVLANMFFFHPSSFNGQEQKIVEASKRKDIGLLVIDTINMFYRMEIENDKEGAMRSFIRQMTRLQMAAREYDIAVVIAEQVYTDKNGEIKPFTHRDTDHMVKTILKLEKRGIGERKATLMKHRFQPEGKTAVFRISHRGLE